MARAKRSPAYPAMSLQEAIDKTNQFYRATKSYPLGRTKDDPAAFRAIGFNSVNGASLRALASLLAFGLLVAVEGGKVKVSDRGQRIIDLPDGVPEKAKLIRDAALAPPIYAELAKEFSCGLPPSDDPMISFLVSKGYSREAIESLIKDFRATYHFANLGKRDIIDDKGGTEQDQKLREDKGSPLGDMSREYFRPAQGDSSSSQPESQGGEMPKVQKVALAFGPGREVFLQIPLPFTDDDFELLKDHLDLMKKSFAREQKASAGCGGSTRGPGDGSNADA